ncbi:MAG: hypothetical protein ACT4TC_04735 [Myxococcaceae bacterium]
MLHRPLALAAVLALLFGSSALAAPGSPDAGTAAPKQERSTPAPLVAVLGLEANKAALDSAPSVSAVIASALAESPQVRLITSQDVSTALGLERQKQLLSTDGNCTDSACLAELSGAVGARYVVSGRLDKFGAKYVLSTSLFDSVKAASLAKPSADAASEEQLPAAARDVAGKILAALGAEVPAPAAGKLAGAVEAAKPADEPVGVWLSLKFGNTFLASLRSLGLGGDIDLGYELAKSWVAFLQIGVTFVRASDDGESGRLNVIPTVIGVRHLYRQDKELQPYWGVGLGVQLAFGQFGFFSDSGPLPNVYAILGLQWMFSKHVGVLVDTSSNIAQAILGLTQSSNGGGFNLDLNVGVVFRF